MSETKQELQKTTTAAVAKPKDIRSLLEGDAFKDQVARALPRHLSADRFIRIALTTLTRTPKLRECDQYSFFDKLLTLSQLGIEPDGRRAHLIPFENRKRGCVECQLIIDYKGLVELIMRSNLVSNIHADVVCENDVFEYDRGEIKKHLIDLRKPRGQVYAAYALVKFKDGSEKAEAMNVEEIESIRKRSKAGGNGPWVTDFNEMAKKTVFRRLSKWLQLSPEYRDAVEKDEDAIEVESERMQTTRPVFSKPLFELPEPAPEPKEPEPTSSFIELIRERLKKAKLKEEALVDYLRTINMLGEIERLDDLEGPVLEQLLANWENTEKILREAK